MNENNIERNEVIQQGIFIILFHNIHFKIMKKENSQILIRL